MLRRALTGWMLCLQDADGNWIGPDGVDGFRDIRWRLENQVQPGQCLAITHGLLGAAFDLGLLESTKLFAGWRMVVVGGLVALFLRWRPCGRLDEALVHRLATVLRRIFTKPSLRTTHAHP